MSNNNERHIPAPAPADDEQKRDRWMRTALGHLAPAGTWPSDLLRRMWHAKDADEAISYAKEAQKRFHTLWGAWDSQTDASKLGPVKSWEVQAPAPVTVSDKMVHDALDLYAAQLEKWGFVTSAMRAVLEAYESARGVGDGWVACSERNPPENDEVLIWHDQVSVGYFDGDDYWAFTNDGDAEDPSCSVTHWRPLPPPPTDKALGVNDGK